MSIAKRDDGRWRAHYRDAAGKEHARHFARKVDAQRWLDDVTSSVVTGYLHRPEDVECHSRRLVCDLVQRAGPLEGDGTDAG